MAGHSKWKQIKHKKAITDKKRGAAFTKLIKEITVAARAGGGDPGANPRLRTLLEKSKEINMPIENSQRAIKRGTGEIPGVQYEQITYEGHGPNGVAIIVDVLTDNRNKAIAEVRHAFTKNGGIVGETGSVNWMFDRMGEVRATNNDVNEDDLIEKLLDYDVTNIALEDGIFTIHCPVKMLDKVRQAVVDMGIKVESAEIEWLPKNPVPLAEEQQQTVLEFLEAVQDLDDVQNVYTNMA
jgi:YebC/PmpR family DNA-binding regulatory protein